MWLRSLNRSAFQPRLAAQICPESSPGLFRGLTYIGSIVAGAPALAAGTLAWAWAAA